MPEPSNTSASRFWAILKPTIWGGVMAFAIWLLHKEWSGFRMRDLNRALSQIGWFDLSLALLCTVASLACNASLDLVALRWLGRRLPTGRVLSTAFVAGSFSMNGGGTILGGGTIRMRFYGQSGLGGAEVAKLTGFLLMAGWLGHAVLAGFLLCVAPPPLAWLAPVAARAAGAILLVSCAALFLLAPRRSAQAAGWRAYLPPWRILLVATVVSAIDWLFAGLALRVLLPSEVESLPFLASTAVGQALGAASHVPGGVGVVELSITKLANGVAPVSTMAGALLTYRMVYYLVPFATAIAAIGLREMWRNRHWAKRTADNTARIWAAIAPRLAGMTALAGGFVLMLSATTPMESTRREFLRDLVPLPFVEASHFLSSIAGTVMIVVASGLLRRVRTAWWMAVLMAAGGVVFSLLKGFDWEEAVVLAVFLAALLPFRSRFHRQAALWTQRFTLQWWVLVGATVGLAVWFGFYTSRHVGYEHDLWWQYSFENDASRVLRAMAGSGIIVLAVALAQWLRPAPVPESGAPPDLGKVAVLVAEAPQSSAALALLGDKRFLFSSDEDAFLMFGEQGRTRVALGHPVGNEESAEELFWRFAEQARDEGMRAAFYQVPAELVPVCVEMGFRIFKLGEQARVDLPSFDLAGGAMKKLRKMVNRMERENWEFALWPPQTVVARMAEIRQVSDEWLAHNKLKEKGFSLGRFDEAYLGRFPMAVILINGRLEAFGNLWPGNGSEELSTDLMRHRHDTPNGVMDCLFVRLMLWGQERGYRWFDLGMAPLSGLASRRFAPLWNRVGGLVFDHGESFYNFSGLRAWKEKFSPEWSPRYLAVPKSWDLPVAILDIANLIGRSPDKSPPAPSAPEPSPLSAVP